MEISVVSSTQPTRQNSLATSTTSSLSRFRNSSSMGVGEAVPKSLFYLAHTVQWDPGDGTLRRFSEPAVDATKANLLVQIASARTAYAKALVSIQQHSSKNVDVKALLKESTQEDVMRLARNLDAASAKKTQGPGSRLLNVLHHYHDVFDVLSQADFSYLCLLWGGIRLILMFAKNRTDLLEKLSDMLVEIGMSLSRIQIYAKLYPTEGILRLTADLYAAVVDFLEQIITTFQKSAVRKLFSSLLRPFEEKYGRAVARIRRLEDDIQRQGFLMQGMQIASMAHHQVDSFLQRHHFQDALNRIPHDQRPEAFVHIKDTLFHGFRHQATYHESLAATYGVTAGPAWEKWFKKEQKYLPSVMEANDKTRLVQGLCDAPDFQHALQWSEKQKAETPDLPWAFLIWAKGMTAQAAIASLVFQLLQQRPAAVAEHNLDIDAFQRANTSITKLWDIFVFLMRELGGCAIYISIGSVGPEEFSLVAKFVHTVRNWKDVPIRVTMIHPYHEKFVLVDDATEIDGAYDVPPSLTTTDALQHVLMPELGARDVSDTIRTVLWESLWRETRFAVIGVALTQLLEKVQETADERSSSVDGDLNEMWKVGVRTWINDDVATNSVREQIQRHLDIVPLEPSDEIRSRLAQYLRLAVFNINASEDQIKGLGSRSLTPEQREHIWGRMQAAICPGTEAMFCGSLKDAVEEALDRLSEIDASGDARHVRNGVRRILSQEFSKTGSWRPGISDDRELVERAIADAIMQGFEDVLEALIASEGI